MEVNVELLQDLELGEEGPTVLGRLGHGLGDGHHVGEVDHDVTPGHGHHLASWDLLLEVDWLESC